MKIDIYDYLDNYLKIIENRILNGETKSLKFNPTLLRQAVMKEMEQADEETGKIELPDNTEDIFSQAEERILEYIKENSVDEVEKDIKAKSSQTPEAQNISIKIPQNLSWKECPIENGNIAFQCNCSKDHTLKLSELSATQSKTNKNLKKSEQVIHKGRTATGNIVAFIISIVIGVIISLASGRTGLVIAIIAVIIFLIIRKIFVRAFMDSLPVWIYICDHCHNKNYIASNGTEAFSGS
jgi:hypothetical protein